MLAGGNHQKISKISKDPDRGLTDLFNGLAGVIDKHETQYQETAGIIRGQNEQRISNSVINNFNQELENAQTEGDLLAVKSKYDKIIADNSDQADDQYKPLWEVAGQSATAAFTGKQVKVQRKEAIDTINLTTKERWENIANNPYVSIPEVEQFVADVLGVKDTMKRIGGSFGIQQEYLAKARLKIRDLQTVNAIAEGDDPTNDSFAIDKKGKNQLQILNESLGIARNMARQAVLAEGKSAYYDGETFLTQSEDKLWEMFKKGMKGADKEWKVPAGAGGEQYKKDAIKYMKEGADEAAKIEAGDDYELSERLAERSDDVSKAQDENWLMLHEAMIVVDGYTPAEATKNSVAAFMDETRKRVG